MLTLIVPPQGDGAKDHRPQTGATGAYLTDAVAGRALRVAGLFAGAALAAACSSGGVMSIDLVLPDDPALSPAGDRVAQLTLVTWEAGQAPRSESRAVDDPGDGLDMGVLTAGREVGVAVELRSATQRLIGYGASPLPVAPERDQDTVVTLQVRRPYVYAAGSPAHLDTFDSTLDPGEEGTFGAIEVAAPVASAPSADGAELVVIAATGETSAELHLVATATHRPVAGAAVPIAGAVSDLAVTADGRLAVVAHDGEAGGLTVVDLEAARRGESQVEEVELGAVGAVAVAEVPGQPARAVALVDRSRAFGCDAALPASSLAVVELSAGLPAASAIDLGTPIADLAAEGGTVYLADPCGGAISHLALDAGGTPAALFSLEAATAVAVQGGRVWGAGAAPPDGADGARALLVSSDQAGANMTSVALPPAQERARSTDFEGEDQRVEVVIEADKLRPFELVALPGGDLVALLTEGYFHSEEWTDIFGDPVVSEIELTTFEYLLVQASSRAVVHRVRTFCDGTATSGATLENFECGAESDQHTVADADMYRPLQLSAIYGGR
jgi:hypothetical protein